MDRARAMLKRGVPWMITLSIIIDSARTILKAGVPWGTVKQYNNDHNRVIAMLKCGVTKGTVSLYIYLTIDGSSVSLYISQSMIAL